ncbi:MAG: hypothetical protein R2794_07845 [Chitinophagales bacterium]
MSFTSVLRMNFIFPYILPNVSLPTNPQIEVMDAGIRDNFGISNPTASIAEFSDWIKENTSGVIVFNIRALECREKPSRQKAEQRPFARYAGPVENLYANWVEIQDYQNEQLLSNLDRIRQQTGSDKLLNTNPGRITTSVLSLHLYSTRETRHR